MQHQIQRLQGLIQTLGWSTLLGNPERRFDQAVVFDGCYIYLDAQGALVIWHALPAELQAVDQVLSRMLSLADLDALDGFANR